MGGGISVPQIQQRVPSQEKKTIGNWQDWIFGTQLPGYVAGSPLLSTAQSDALNFAGPFMNEFQNFIAPVLQSGGALTPQEQRDVSQQERTIASQLGVTDTTGEIGRELLSRDAAKTQRLAQYSALGQSVAGGTLNQLTGVQQAETGTFAQLVDPIYGYLSNLYAGNQQASEVAAQLSVAAQQANASKGAGVGGGALSGLSSIFSSALGSGGALSGIFGGGSSALGAGLLSDVAPALLAGL